MGYETPHGQFFDIAKKASKSILDLFSEGDEIYLIVFNSEPLVLTPQPSSEFDDLKQLISETELSFGNTHFFKALSSAYEFLGKSKNLNKEIYLLTDLDKAGWSNQEVNLPDHKNIKLFLIQMDKKERNFGIKSLNFGTRLIKKNAPFEISAKISNYSSGSVDNLLVGFYLDGKRVAQTDIAVNGNSEKDVNFSKTAEVAGVHYGHLELSDDELLADNKRYFVLEVPDDIKILLVGKEKDTYYVNLALIPKEDEKSSINVITTDVNSLSKEKLSEYDAILFCNVSNLNSSQLLDLERYIKEGGGIFFSLGDEVDLKFYNEHIMKRFFNSTIKAPVMGLDKKGFFSWQDLDTEHPIFQPYEEIRKEDFPQVRFFYFFEATQPSASKILANFTSLSPALMEKSFGKGKIIMLLGSFNHQDSDITRHTIFVPFIHRTVEYLAADLSGWKNDYLVGSEIRRDLSSSYAGKEIKLIDPQNKETDLKSFFLDNRLWLKIPQSNLPGIYHIESEGKTIDRIAVNVDPFESNPRRMEPNELKEMLQAQDIIYINQDEEIKQKVKEARHGKEIGKSFLWAVLILVIMEMLIARTRSKEMITE
jgi:hypothetical protein